MGVELEVEVGSDKENSDVAEAIYAEHKDEILIKHDGSLDNGFEMVTGKYSLEAHQELWPRLAKKAVEAGARSWRYRSTGLHVHLSRAFFTSPLQIGKFVTFINSERNRPEVVKLAGRDSNGYAQFKKKRLSTAMYSSERYEAVNLTNDHTIEVRIFKGTLKVEHILSDIEFCHAVAHWVKEQGLQDFESWEKFKAWVIKNRKTYKYLSTFFKLGTFAYPNIRSTEEARELVLA